MGLDRCWTPLVDDGGSASGSRDGKDARSFNLYAWDWILLMKASRSLTGYAISYAPNPYLAPINPASVSIYTSRYVTDAGGSTYGTERRVMDRDRLDLLRLSSFLCHSPRCWWCSGNYLCCSQATPAR